MAAPLSATASPRSEPSLGVTEPIPQREERRLATALFCDLVGFTPLSERLDAEQVRSVQTAYFETMSEEIGRFGGQVEKFAGDAVLALFGIPVSYGDDAERAVLCALAMQARMAVLSPDLQERWGTELALRVGVNTGEAVSGILDAGGRKDYSVTGDVVNTAARLQTAAEPGSIMAGEETMRLARKRIRFGERRELSLKGKSRTVAAYQVLGPRERLIEEHDSGRRITPLIGRDHELGILLQAWEQAQKGEGQLVTLVADAGVGKSRLLTEVVDRAIGEGRGRAVWGSCLSYGQDLSLGLIGDLTRSLIEVHEQDDPSHVRRRLQETLASLLAEQDDDMRAAANDVLGELLGLPDGSSGVSAAGALARRQVLIKTLRLLLLSLTREEPAVLVLEDLQWIDSSSAEVLAETLSDVPSLRLLVLAARRPGWTAPWAEWSWVEQLNLRPLGDREAATLARQVLGTTPLSPELERYVAERAGGNPFFVEELLHVLEESGGITLQEGEMQLVPAAAERLPSTLTEILLARLDALEEGVRSLVQVASVIGRNFPIDLLAQVSGRLAANLEATLSVLPRAEIAFPVPGSKLEYAFKHVTMRDVAYNTLLTKRRQELHAATAHAMTALYSTDEMAEIVAYHFSQTTEHATAAIWLERAGDRSADMYANQAAITHYEEARRRLELSDATPIALARIGEKLGSMFRIVAWYEEALEELQSAAAVYREGGDAEGEARTVAQISQVHFLRGASDQAIDSVRQVLQRVDLDDDDAPSHALADLYIALVDPLCDLHRFEDAMTAGYRAMELARRHGDERLLVEATVHYGLALQGMGRLNEARHLLEQAIPTAERAGDPASLAKALMWLGDICVALGLPLDGKAYYERAVSVDEDRGDLAETASLLGRLGQVAFILGEWDQARELYERTVELVRSISFAHFSAAALMTLGEHYRREGAEEQASRYLEEPFTIAERSGQLAQLPYLQIPLAAWDVFAGDAEAALQRLDPLQADPHFETPLDHRAMQVAAEAYLLTGRDGIAEKIIAQGLEFAAGQTNRLALLGWLQVRSALEEARGDVAAAETTLEEALALARSMPHAYEEACILYRQGSARQKRGVDGSDSLEDARRIFERLGAAPYLERVRSQLLDRTPA